MPNQNSTVVQLPTELFRLKEADRLVMEWGRIQQLDDEARVIALFSWYGQMERHLARFKEAI